MAQDNHQSLSFLQVLGEKIATGVRLHAEQREEVVRYEDRGRTLRLTSARYIYSPRLSAITYLRTELVLFPPIDKIRGSHRIATITFLSVVLPDHYQTFRVREWQLPQ